MIKRAAAFLLSIGLVGAGLWMSAGFGTTQLWLFGAGLVGLVGIASESYLTHSPAGEPAEQYHIFLLWIPPALLVVAGLWLTQVTPADSQLGVALAMAALAGANLLAVGASLEPGGRYYRPARFLVNLIVYLLSFLLFALIYHARERGLFTATSIGLVALLGGLELLRYGGRGQVASWPLAALGALIVAETAWALNYWPVSGLLGGAVLLLTFYVFGGLLLAIREGGLDRRMLVEYGSVGAVGLVAIGWAMR